MAAPLVPIIVVLILLAVVVVGVAAWASRRQRVSDELASTAAPTLDYLVPPGQDPVILTTALDAEGYTVTTDPRNALLVHVSCPAGPDRDRARVRAVISSVHTTALDAGQRMEIGEVRFTDE
jgi:hypothetical protein